jgi:hypothetical protein
MIAKERKKRPCVRHFDALVAEHRGLNDHGIEKILDRIGTGQRR